MENGKSEDSFDLIFFLLPRSLFASTKTPRYHNQ